MAALYSAMADAQLSRRPSPVSALLPRVVGSLSMREDQAVWLKWRTLSPLTAHAHQLQIREMPSSFGALPPPVYSHVAAGWVHALRTSQMTSLSGGLLAMRHSTLAQLASLPSPLSSLHLSLSDPLMPAQKEERAMLRDSSVARLPPPAPPLTLYSPPLAVLSLSSCSLAHTRQKQLRLSSPDTAAPQSELRMLNPPLTISSHSQMQLLCL